jgi:N-acetylmuramoyl-L-alanine amidase
MRDNLLWAAAYAGCTAAVVIFFNAGGVASLQRVSREMQTAAVFFVTSITVGQIQNDYEGVQVADPVTGVSAPAPSKKVRILIVPGHQPDTGGTEFRGVLERDIAVDIADALAELLAQNPHYDVIVARTKTAWNPVLQNYFDAHAADIEAFRQSQKAQMQNYLASGSILPAADQVYHNSTSGDAALQLYGINKWASDNGVDITLHLHINNDDEHGAGAVGNYDGFAVYVPDRQYSNAEASKVIGSAIAARLNAYHATSTLPKEDAGVAEDQKLIAVGSNNSASDAALLIEYGYIYEPQFLKPSVRAVAVTDYAYETYLGLQDFFKAPAPFPFGSVSFPYDWSEVDTAGRNSGPGIYALQAALHYLGYYPPAGKSFSDCPVSGMTGPCTRAALSAYQTTHGLEATGALGPQTQAKLEFNLTHLAN